MGNILIIDNVVQTSELLSRSLSDAGHNVTTVIDGLRALVHLHARPFDLVVLNVTPPELFGYEVLTTLKTSIVLKEIPVIVIAENPEPDSFVRCMKLGAEDYFTIPIDIERFCEQVLCCIEKRQTNERAVSQPETSHDQIEQWAAEQRTIARQRKERVERLEAELQVQTSFKLINLSMI